MVRKFLNSLHTKKRCEFGMIIGTILSLFGIYLLTIWKIGYLITGPIMAAGKVLVIVSLIYYVRYRKIMSGEEIKKGKLSKVLRNIKESAKKFKPD